MQSMFSKKCYSICWFIPKWMSLDLLSNTSIPSPPPKKKISVCKWTTDPLHSVVPKLVHCNANLSWQEAGSEIVWDIPRAFEKALTGFLNHGKVVRGLPMPQKANQNLLNAAFGFSLNQKYFSGCCDMLFWGKRRLYTTSPCFIRLAKAFL